MTASALALQLVTPPAEHARLADALTWTDGVVHRVYRAIAGEFEQQVCYHLQPPPRAAWVDGRGVTRMRRAPTAAVWHSAADAHSFPGVSGRRL